MSLAPDVSARSKDDNAPEIILDVSRLLSRIRRPTPTGIDRVELAYARGLHTAAGDRLAFSAVHPMGWYGRIPADAVLRFLDATEGQWEGGGTNTRWRETLALLLAMRPVRPSVVKRRSRVYIKASPDHLTREAGVRAILRREQARLVCLVHDLIPIEFPEYARPNGYEQHISRVDTIARHASGVITNSHATMQSLTPWLERANAKPERAIAHLGIDHLIRPLPQRLADPPYFIVVSTIEPRKNHLLLLNVWRRLSERFGADNIPKLKLVGKRGWENEQVIDMLERCEALRGCVEEYSSVCDRDVRILVGGACGLLMPSFAEGYGMPVAEALQAGVPVLCSDLPALRETGGNAPEFLDPIDGPMWMAMIMEYAATDSPVRAAQVMRIQHWKAPTWTNHIAILLDLLHRIG